MTSVANRMIGWVKTKVSGGVRLTKKRERECVLEVATGAQKEEGE